jgi:hypothetical protein
MSVQLTPKNKHCHDIDVASGTWFTLVSESDVTGIIGPQSTHDLGDVDNETALKIANVLESWNPPNGWFIAEAEEEGKEMFLDFFRNCGGFSLS